MSDSNSSSSGGGRVLGLLGVAFVVLKLTHVIDWSWWYVTMPFWGGFALVLVVMSLGVLGIGVFAGIGSYFAHRRREKLAAEIRRRRLS